MKHKQLYLNYKNSYDILNEWENIINVNNIWKRLNTNDIMVSRRYIVLLELFSAIFNNILRTTYWNINHISKHLDTKDILKDISDKFKITILILNHDGSYNTYTGGQIVVMLYRYNDNNYKHIGLIRNNHIYRYIYMNSYDYDYIINQLYTLNIC